MQTFAQFKTKLRQTIWPAGEPFSLRKAHDNFFVQAMLDIQRWVPCVQQNNRSQFKQCATYWDCAKTVVDAPNGVIRRVYTIANDEWCDKVFYQSDTFADLQCWSDRLYGAKVPVNVGLPKLPMGFRNAEASTDSVCGRARIGSWAIERRRLYIAPWIQSNETLVIEWDGLKNSWVDTDGVDETIRTVDFENAVAIFVKAQHERFFGAPGLARELEQTYRDQLADLIWYCKETTRQQEAAHSTQRVPTAAQIAASAVPEDEEDATALAGIIGDWGEDGDPLFDNVSLIESQHPKIVLTVGDNIYGVSPSPTIDSLFGKYFSKRIYPYTGAYVAGTEHSFWPTWGNHDHDYGLTQLLNFLPSLKGNKRYYSVVQGPVQFFILDSDPREADGGYVNSTTSTENSVMGQWLRVNLALSTAKWKVVICHHAPYSSDDTYTPGARWMRWPFKLWGAHMVLSGHAHDYEDLLIDNLPYVVNGLGGKSIRGFTGAVSGSQFQYNDNYGIGLIYADCNALTHKFFSRNGTLIRTVTVATAGSGVVVTLDTGAGIGSGGSGSDGGATNVANQVLIEWTAGENYQILVPTYDGGGFMTSATIKWPDGSGGVYTVTVKNTDFDLADAYTVTHAATGKTVTQPLVTRNASGQITNKPPLTVS